VESVRQAYSVCFLAWNNPQSFHDTQRNATEGVPYRHTEFVFRTLRGCFRIVSEKGTVPFSSPGIGKLGQSPTILKLPPKGDLSR